MAMRDGFREIVSGWMLIDGATEDGLADLSDRIERASQWLDANGPFNEDELATLAYMRESQMARSFRLLLSGDPADFTDDEHVR